MDYDDRDGFAITHLPGPFQPWLAPANGVPHLWITEMVIDPNTHNNATYDNAIWLHRAMDNRGNLADTDSSIDIGQEIKIGTVIRLNEDEKKVYFDFYKQTRTNTSEIQVTFPSGLIKYYTATYLEVSCSNIGKEFC